MALLDKLQTQGSLLTDLDGKTPTAFDGASQYQKDLEKSNLDLDGKKPLVYDRQTKQIVGLTYSQLDLEKPTKYLDNLPK